MIALGAAAPPTLERVARSRDVISFLGQHPLHDIEIGRIVVDDKNDILAVRTGSRSVRNRTRIRDKLCRLRLGGHPNGKARTLAELADHGDIAAHQPAKLLAERQSEARAAILARCRAFSLAKVLEKIDEVLRTDADAGISYRDLNPAIMHRRGQRDRAELGELRSVFRDVYDGLPKLGHIGLDDAGLIRAIDDKLIPFAAI